MKKILFLILILATFQVKAATYYIATTGSNSAAGTISAPWQTLSYACAHVTNPGDIIHVNAGTYTETAQSNLAVGVSIEGEGSTVSIINANYAADPLINLSSGTGNTNGNQSISYLKFDGNSLMGTLAISVYQRGNVIIHDCDFVNFNYEACRFRSDGNVDNECSVYSVGNEIYNNTITNCAAYHASWGDGALWLMGQQDMLIHDNTITCTSRGAGADGWCIKATEGWFKGLKIYNNTLTKNTRPSGYFNFAMEIWHPLGGLEIYGNTIQGEVDITRTQKNAYAYGLSFHDNVCGWNTAQPTENVGLRMESEMETALIYNNVFKNISNCIQAALGDNGDPHITNNVTIRNNILYNTTPSVGGPGIMIQTDGTASTISNWSILNNVLYNTDDTGYRGIEISNSGTFTGIKIQNNVIQGYIAAPIGIISGSPTCSNFTVTNNMFTGSGNGAANWGGVTITNKTESNNHPGENPLFVSVPTNFQLQSGSPCIDAGINIGLPFNGSAPDIGYYETGTSSATTPTVTLVSTTVGSTTISVDGNVTSDGGATVTERGICYGTSTAPDTTGTHVPTGSGTGTFTSNITGLSGSTLYYLRTYATNSAGTAYSSQVTVTTTPRTSIPASSLIHSTGKVVKY